MGGDGGTKAVNRSYLRGAGAASTTADSARHKDAIDPAVTQEEAARAMKTCALTDLPLDFGSPIVVCPYGRLYNKEAVVEALIRRKNPEIKNGDRLLGDHIRGLKDVYDVRFKVEGSNPICPVTGRLLNGKIAAYAFIPSPGNHVNVVSEYAIKELGEDTIIHDHGKNSSQKIRLVPPPDLLSKIKNDLKAARQMEAEANLDKQMSKKAKRKSDELDEGKKSKLKNEKAKKNH
jgi:hypothetical protein